MKIKLISLALGAALLSSSMVYAQESEKDSEDNFAEHKTQMVKDLTDEKAGIDQVIACVNSAKKKDDMKACYDLKKANMEKMHERRRSERKERLQNEIKKLDEEGQKAKK